MNDRLEEGSQLKQEFYVCANKNLKERFEEKIEYVNQLEIEIMKRFKTRNRHKWRLKAMNSMLPETWGDSSDSKKYYNSFDSYNSFHEC